MDELVETPDSDDFVVPAQREAEIQRKKERWLTSQPKSIQKLAAELGDSSPKQILAFVRKQLVENVFVVGAYKHEIFWACVHAMEIARRKKKPNDMIAAAKLLAQIERESISLLKGMDRSSFEIKGENVQVNIHNDREQEIRDAEHTVARYREVIGDGGTVPVDRAELPDPDKAEDDCPVHIE